MYFAAMHASEKLLLIWAVARDGNSQEIPFFGI
jgi:hypothetical protein